MTPEEEIAQLKQRVTALEEGLRTVAWLHHELVFGLKLAGARRAVDRIAPQLAQLIAGGQMSPEVIQALRQSRNQ